MFNNESTLVILPVHMRMYVKHKQHTYVDMQLKMTLIVVLNQEYEELT